MPLVVTPGSGAGTRPFLPSLHERAHDVLGAPDDVKKSSVGEQPSEKGDAEGIGRRFLHQPKWGMLVQTIERSLQDLARNLTQDTVVAENLLVVRLAKEATVDCVDDRACGGDQDTIPEVRIHRKVPVEDMLTFLVQAPRSRVLGKVSECQGGPRPVAADHQDRSIYENPPRHG